MKRKFNLKIYIIFFFGLLFFNSVVDAKPRCEQFYEDLYNQTEYPRDVDWNSWGSENSIGFRLLNIPNEEANDWNIAKDQDGYLSNLSLLL